MQLVNSISRDDARAALPTSTSLTIGNFDGFHLGHQKLVRAARQGTKANLKSLLITFDPHPDDFFAQNQNLTPLLQSPTLKRQAADELGVDLYLEQRFDQKFAGLSAENFFNDFLCNALSCRRISVGQEFRFGQQRRGNTELLAMLSREKGVQLEVVQEQLSEHENKVISSSWIRHLLRDKGDTQQASQLLARPYLVTGHVTKGDQRGRTIDAATLNLKPEEPRQVIPLTGVYSGHIWLESITDHQRPLVFAASKTLLPAVINIGYKPTVADNGTSLTIEAHVIDRTLPFDSCYGLRIGIYFQERLRDEKRFGSMAQLKAQISTDIAIARKLLLA